MLDDILTLEGTTMAGFRKSRFHTDIDFQRQGRQTGFLYLPHSAHRSAYGRIAIPVVVLNNGPGPGVLLCAGNHGDEYEGQVALMDLCRELQPQAMRGRLIILPAANFPAVRAGTRTSPLDAGNLNRAFPGDPDGTPTAAIAHYIESELLPLVELVVDLHSGGSSLRYIPSTLRGESGDPALDERSLELQRVFSAPIGYTVKAMGEDRTLGAAARRRDAVYLATEAGGGGDISPAGAAVVRTGLARLLHHVGSLPGEAPAPAAPASRLLVVARPGSIIRRRRGARHRRCISSATGWCSASGCRDRWSGGIACSSWVHRYWRDRWGAGPGRHAQRLA